MMNKKSEEETQRRPITPSSKTLVAYFSWSGNTREVAKQIHKVVGGDLFEIVSVDSYPSDYNECVRQAKRELDAGYMPKLKSEAKGIESYEVVIIGYPNWWGTVPRPVASFLAKCNLSNKIIAPFCTHGGDRLGSSVEDIAALCPDATISEGLAIRDGDEGASSRLSAWLRRIGLTE